MPAPAAAGARRQSFTQFIAAKITALAPAATSAQTERDKTRATSWERYVHCCTALGYALAQSGAIMIVVVYFSSWDWVGVNDAGNPKMKNGVIIKFRITALAALSFATYCNIAQSRETPDGRSGPRYARWVIAVTVLLVPLFYGALWALEEHADVDIYYNVVFLVGGLVYGTTFIIVDIAGRQWWSDRDRSKRSAQPSHVADDSVAAQVATTTAAAPSSRRAIFADTVLNLVTILVSSVVGAFCKCAFYL